MSRIKRQRDIIDRKALIGELDKVAGWSGYSSKTRGKILQIFKEARNKGVAEIRRRFETEALPGSEAVRAQSFLTDQIIRVLHDFTLQYVYPVANPTTGELMSIAATGGYGRAELAPHSDIDLMFLRPYKRTPHTEQMVEYMLYMLWDLGLKVGHATRSIGECIRLAREDLTIRTSLLEARWLWGNEPLFQEFKNRYAKEVITGSGADFVEAKLAERDARHEKMGDTRYVLEPNIKEGKGGLRDLQTLLWIAKYLYKVDDMAELVERDILTRDDARRFEKAQNFLWTVRCNLHYINDRPDERLTFNVQDEIGRRMAYGDRAGVRGVERFMKHYFLVAKDVGDLTRTLCAVLEEQQTKRRFRFPRLSFGRPSIEGFRLEGDRLAVEHFDDFALEPVKMIRLFHEAQRHGLDIHPRTLRLVSRSLKRIDGALRSDPEANRLFLDVLTSKNNPEMALKRLNEAGVIGRFIPDFGRVVAQMQYDMYHVYTVDEHTIRAIGFLNRIEKGDMRDEHPVASSVIGEVESRRALFVAVLLHDIAKGRGGDHSELGAEIALKLAPRLGLNDWETEIVSWLVRHHLDMSHTAFKRDLDDPKAIGDFVATVQSPERLRMLLLLTIADIRAVGPNVWNGWKSGLLRELYFRSQEAMAGTLPSDMRAARVEKAKHSLRVLLTGWDEAEIEAHLARGYPQYWLAFNAEIHFRHAEMIRAAEEKGLNLHIETRVDGERDATEIIVYTHDHPGLFAHIAGAMALSGASVVDAKITTLVNGMALDIFWVQDFKGGAFDSQDRLKRVWKRIEDALAGRLNPSRELEASSKSALPSRTRVFTVPPRVLIDNKASSSHTVIEVNGRDRVGFLYDVTAALNELSLQISSAHVSTYGERVVDVFYVKDVFGLKVEHEEKLNALRRALLSAVDPLSLDQPGEASEKDDAAA